MNASNKLHKSLLLIVFWDINFKLFKYCKKNLQYTIKFQTGFNFWIDKWFCKYHANFRWNNPYKQILIILVIFTYSLHYKYYFTSIKYRFVSIKCRAWILFGFIISFERMKYFKRRSAFAWRESVDFIIRTVCMGGYMCIYICFEGVYTAAVWILMEVWWPDVHSILLLPLKKGGEKFLCLLLCSLRSS